MRVETCGVDANELCTNVTISNVFCLSGVMSEAARQR